MIAQASLNITANSVCVTSTRTHSDRLPGFYSQIAHTSRIYQS